MSLTIQNFDSPEDIITQRGKEYFDAGNVTSLEEVDKGEWVATVYGSIVYDVEVDLASKKIEFTDCTCAYFEENERCKHVAAVLYAIRERKTKPTKKAAKEKDKKPK